jgi:hypothetical protein
MIKISLLIPTTSNKREWKNINETYLVNTLIKSLKIIINKKNSNKNIEYKLFIGIDKDDTFFDNENNQNEISNLIDDYCDIEFIYLNTEKGYLSKAWNILFKKAYEENYDYFYQCGDDIDFNKNENYFEKLIEILKNQNNYGVTGAHCMDRKDILTQSFVSRKHMELFGFYFPEEIRNWFVDDLISIIYKEKYYTPYKEYIIKNVAGGRKYNQRYNITRVKKPDFKKIIDKYKNKLSLIE